jgi:SAM-dependent methyltransferase
MPDDGEYGEAVAAQYDASIAERFGDDVIGPTIDFLFELAGAGRALELGIGTGRVALPLARRGVPVHGIDLSEAMLAQLQAKPGGNTIPVSVGDFSSTSLSESFRLVFLVFNTIMNLGTQAEQVSCFRNAAEHLEPGGFFVVEVMLPDLQRLPLGETIRITSIGESRLSFDEYDIVRQGLISHTVSTGPGQNSHQSAFFRYVWPAELDLMAEMAGMRLHERWASWNREPLTNGSHQHISVWQKPVHPT